MSLGQIACVSLQVYFACVLGVSGATKLWYPAPFMRTLHRVSPGWMAAGLGMAIPWTEVATAAALLSGEVPSIAASATVTLLVAFLVVEAMLLLSGQAESCGCYGAAYPRRVDGASIAATAVSVVLGVVLLGLSVAVQPVAWPERALLWVPLGALALIVLWLRRRRMPHEDRRVVPHLVGARGVLYSPMGVAVDDAGLIYVADTHNHRIQRFSPDGELVDEWGGLTGADALPGRFYRPKGVAISPDGSVYVADTLRHRVQKLSASGQALTHWGTMGTAPGDFQEPTGIAVDSGGMVYVADRDNHRIQKFDSFGKLLASWGTEGCGPGQFQRPERLAVDRDGAIYVADTHNRRIQKLSSDGEPLNAWGPSLPGGLELSCPAGVALDASGNIHVTDRANHRVCKLRPNGSVLACWGGQGTQRAQFRFPEGIAVDRQGNIYVADRDNDRVQILAPTGAVIATLGRPGSQDDRTITASPVVLGGTAVSQVPDAPPVS